MGQEHDRRQIWQTVCLIGLLLCGFLYYKRSTTHNVPIRQQVTNVKAPPQAAHSGLTLTLEGPSHMQFGEQGTQFMMTVRNTSRSEITLGTRYRMLAFY